MRNFSYILLNIVPVVLVIFSFMFKRISETDVRLAFIIPFCCKILKKSINKPMAIGTELILFY